MRQRLTRVDTGFLVVLALLVLASWPFLAHPELPRATDAELHVFRLAELARLVGAGELYPRWAPNFYFGYGYPIFNYYAPLSYYAGLPAALAPWWDAVDGVRFVFILGLAAGTAGCYAFTRRHWGRPAGLVAAAVYSFAPYILYVDPHARGDLAEAFSLGLFPLALWTVDRLRQATGGAWLLAVILVAAVILSHNLMALVSFALLFAWSLWQCASLGEGRPVCALRLAALAAGTGLAAFFWLPVALEQGAVNLDTLIGEGGHFDYRNHFLSLSEMLAPAQRLDWGATEAAFRFNLGIGQWVPALIGLILLLAGKTRHGRRLAFFALAALALVAMMLPLSALLWQTVPLLPFLQFPWRLLGATIPMLAVLAGAGSEALSRLLAGRLGERAAGWVPAFLVLLALLPSLPLLQVPPWPATAWDTTAWGVLAEELQGRWLGTTSTADFVPATVDVIPGPAEQMLQAIRAGEPPDRVNRATLPGGATVRQETVTPLHTRYHVVTAEPFLLRLFQFSFPGWVARIDGVPVATEVGRPEGFLVVPVPAGEHTVSVALSPTPVQRGAWFLSGLSVLAAGAVALWLRRRHSLLPAASVATESDPVAVSAAGPILAGVLMVGLLSALLAPLGVLHDHSTGNTAIPAEHDTFVIFGDEIALIGYDLPRNAEAGETVAITLYWKAQRQPEENYQVFVHLLRPDGTILAQSDKLNPGEFPSRRWPLTHYVRDQHRLRLPATIPPGSYTLAAGLWLQAEERRLPPGTGGDFFPLGEVTVGD